MLYEFLLKNQKEVLAMTEKKTLELAGATPSSLQLKQGLPIFYSQLMEVLQLEGKPKFANRVNVHGMVTAANHSDEPALAIASGRPNEAMLATAGGRHGQELQRLGYTLSHVVHAYGAMCQSITKLASIKNAHITADEFHDLNRCLDVAIAGAVTEYQSQRNNEDKNREIEHLGFLAHELRNALSSVNISIRMIKMGTVGFGGSTGQILENSLKRIESLIDRSLTEVRLRVDPIPYVENAFLIHLVDQIVITADVEAAEREQTIEIQIDPKLIIEADQQLFYSALSNLIQNAIKYTRIGGHIHVRGNLVGDQIVVEVEDECGGLSDSKLDLFKPYAQANLNKEGLGLGLTIAKRAITLNKGVIEVKNLPSKGCIFKITLPKQIAAG
jgi:signal transduction histidine kinase